MNIILSGTPGTGKTTIAKKLAEELNERKIQISVFDLKKFIKQNNLSKKGIVSIPDLSKKLSDLNLFKKGKKNYLIENHLLCEFKIPADFIFVLRTDPNILKKRLKKRRYSNKKINENLDAEALDYCAQRIEKVYKKEAIELDTTKRSINESVAALVAAIAHKQKKIDEVDFSVYLLPLLSAPKKTKKK